MSINHNQILLDMKKDLTECELFMCDGSGILIKQNGPDDFDEDFCLCDTGQELEAAGRAEAYDQYERNTGSSVIQSWIDDFRRICRENGLEV